MAASSARSTGSPSGVVVARCTTGALRSSARARSGWLRKISLRMVSACVHAGLCKRSSLEIMHGPVRAWPLTLALDRAEPSPLSVQIARGLIERIRVGALGPGAPLPSSRALARRLGVHRNTVLAAYGELGAEGWLETAPARGTTVARDLPPAQRAARGRAAPAG